MLKSQKNEIAEITIVIITYKRYGFLKRLLSFYALTGYNFNLLVLDSTPYKPTDEDLLFLLKSNFKLKWVRYDSSIFFVNKIADGSKYINTKFSVLCADDDFILPSGILKSIKFLEANLEYTSCHGMYYDYEFQNSKKPNLGNVYGKINGGNENSSIIRVTNYLNGVTIYHPLFAVCRTIDFKTIWENSKIYTQDWGLSEIFPCALSLIMGKMKILSFPYSIREKNNLVWYDDNRENQMYSSDKVDKCINGLVSAFKNEKKEVKRVLKNSLNERFKSRLLKKNNTLESKAIPSIKISLFMKIKNKFSHYYNLYYQYYQFQILLKNENKELINALKMKNNDNINTSRNDYANQGSIK